MIIFVARPCAANSHGEVKVCALGKGSASKEDNHKLALNFNACTGEPNQTDNTLKDRRQERAKTHTIASKTTHMTVTTDPALKHTPDIPYIHDGQQITHMNDKLQLT